MEKYGFENDRFSTVDRRESVIFPILCYRLLKSKSVGTGKVQSSPGDIRLTSRYIYMLAQSCEV